MRRVFLAAYTCSGLAGLIYQVSWARLLTLFIGHTTAAASTVVAAFLGGLAIGAAAGGRVASRLSPPQALGAYAALEIFVVLAALALPLELSALTPLLRSAYADGATGWAFPLVRVTACLAMVFVPALALGATYPMAIRWYAEATSNPAKASGTLYVVNTIGAAAGALLAGFVLIPSMGLTGTLRVAMAASLLAATGAWLAARAGVPESSRPGQPSAPARAARRTARPAQNIAAPPAAPAWVAATVLAISGFTALVHEIAWTRILALVIGPTTYAFAAALASVITGVALGSAAATWVLGRTRRPALWLAATLAGAAAATAWTGALAGDEVPLLVAQRVAESPEMFQRLVREAGLLASVLVLPTAALLGAAFPLGLALVGGGEEAARRFSLIYAWNTLGAVSGSLAAGFVLVPVLGLQGSLRFACAGMIAAGLIVVARGALPRRAQAGALGALALAGVLTAASPPWNREMLASGGYLYAPFVPRGLDLETMLSAGELLYYREGASATVSVKRLTGTTTLAVDGKTDASNRGDVLTQKLLAHIPLLLHDAPRDVAVIGLGSGATAGAALLHPVSRVDVIEISKEVVEASAFFAEESRNALADPRTNLIVGDGRSHLLLAARQYDVIISEPSNPWIAGVAALFTSEFFAAARARLAPGGVMCQWANAYNISDADLRGIVATFRSAFPDATVWLVGESDILLLGGTGPVAARLERISRNWTRPGVAEDLASMQAAEPFALLASYMGGPAQLDGYAGTAQVFTDDRMSLEFSAPREIYRRGGAEDNVGPILALLAGPSADGAPEPVRRAKQQAAAPEWRRYAEMLEHADAHPRAYDAFVRALTIDPSDRAALGGLVRQAVLLDRGADALSWLRTLAGGQPDTVERLIARSKLLAAIGEAGDAVLAAAQAARLDPTRGDALEQLADLHATGGSTAELDTVVTRLRAVRPGRAGTLYYEAAAAFLHGRVEEALPLVEQAIQADPRYAPAYDLLGACLMKLGQGARAGAAFDKSLDFNPRDSTAYANLGFLQLAAGNARGAADYFAQALWLAPDDELARRGLAQALGASGGR